MGADVVCVICGWPCASPALVTNKMTWTLPYQIPMTLSYYPFTSTVLGLLSGSFPQYFWRFPRGKFLCPDSSLPCRLIAAKCWGTMALFNYNSCSPQSLTCWFSSSNNPAMLQMMGLIEIWRSEALFASLWITYLSDSNHFSLWCCWASLSLTLNQSLLDPALSIVWQMYCTTN